MTPCAKLRPCEIVAAIGATGMGEVYSGTAGAQSRKQRLAFASSPL